jgi:hypothetical protein
MEGNVVNMWEVPEGFTIEKTARLLENGNHLRAIRPLKGVLKTGGTGIIGSVFQEVDWKGKVMWEWQDPKPNYVAHHNFKRIHNKKLGGPTTLIIATKGTGKSIYLSHEETVPHGANPTECRQEQRGTGEGTSGDRPYRARDAPSHDVLG